MPAMFQHLLAVPTAATTAVFVAFSIYYLAAASHVVETSVTRYSRFDLPLREVLSLVPSGLVRKRGVLFLTDVLYLQLVPHVVEAHEGIVAFSWALRLVLGAAQAYYNVAVLPDMWRPWPGTAEVLTMSLLSLLWIRATVKASQKSQRKAIADIIDSVEDPEDLTESGENAESPARRHGGPTPSHQAVPTPISLVLTAAALLSCFGIGIMANPDLAVQQAVADSFERHHDAVQAAVNADTAGSGQGSDILFRAVHLATSRAFAQMFGLQLLMESLQLFLLPSVLPDLPAVLCLLLACAARAALTTGVCVYNNWLDGGPLWANADVLMSAAFLVAYLALYLAYQKHWGAGKGAKTT